MRSVAFVSIAFALALPPQNRSLLLKPDAPEFVAPAPERSVVRFETSKGNIDIEVFRDWAPLGGARFVNLVRYGYYDECRFFRVTAGRWVQFGVSGDPAIATAWRNKTLTDDPFVKAHSNVRGTVAFAYGVPNGRTTQVFINLRDNSETHDTGPNGPFAVFGRVLDGGMEVADTLTSEYDEGPGGIRAGHQDEYFSGGNAWLAKTFPNLDFIRRATLVSR